MDKPKLISNRAVFNSKNREFKEMATAHMAQDIEILIKTGRTPVKTGNLKSLVKHRRMTNGYRVESNADYSAVQELGIRRGARAFTNYTTSGTGSGWFKNAIDKVESKKESYIREASRSAKI
jgi:hypothetical protein